MFLTTTPTFEITVGIANAMPATNNTLNVVISIIFVVTPMSMIDTIHVVNAIVSKRFIPIRLLTRPANRDNNIPITPNNFIIEDTDISPPTWCDVTYSFKISYILINIISNVSEINKQ